MKPDNFFAAEPLLIARLRATLPADVHVLAAADLAGVAADQQPTPAVHVVYGGYQAGDSKTPAVAGVDQTWYCIVVTRDLTDIEEGQHARQAAGLLAAQVMQAMHRHRLRLADGTMLGARSLELATAPDSGFHAGHFYLPLAWLCHINFVSDTCPA